jgi:hypothetical protein
VIAKEQALWKKTGEETLVLVPVNLDDFMFSDASNCGWKNQVVSRLAPDFRNWKNDSDNDVCEDALSTLLRALIIDSTAAENLFSQT